MEAFLATITDPQQQDDARVIDQLMREVSGCDPCMCGDTIIGYGSYTYRYASGREGEWMKIGFSPRKGKLSIYLMDRMENHEDLLERLGKYKSAVACLYIKKLKDVDMTVFREMIERSYRASAMGEV